MHKLLSLPNNILSDKLRTLLLIVFLFLLGSHFLDYHLSVFIIAALFLINWKYITNKNFLLVFLFLISLYTSWVFIDSRLLHLSNFTEEVFLSGLLILLMYLLGFSIPTKEKNGILLSNKNMFYILFIFAISYSFFVFYSYMIIPQDTPLTGLGMYVCFPNPYQQLHVNGGRLISTILTYYFTLMVLTLPLILIYFNKFKKQGFYTIELLLLVLLSLFILYISAIMGRRTVFILFTMVFMFLFISYIITNKHIKKVFLSFVLLSTLFYGINTLSQYQKETPKLKAMVITDDLIIPIVHNPTKELLNIQNIPVFNKLTHKGLKDHRFSWWKNSFQVMLDYPLGGGHGVYIARNMKLTHNVWLDIGKDFGILPFVLFCMITFIHIYYLIRIFFSRQVENLLKYQLLIIGVSLFAIMIIEPVFNSDKTFFAYIFFYFGIVSKYYLELNKQSLQK